MSITFTFIGGAQPEGPDRSGWTIDNFTDDVREALSRGWHVSESDYVGFINVHDGDFLWELCVAYTPVGLGHVITLTAVSDAWCDSRQLHKKVTEAMVNMSGVLSISRPYKVILAPVPAWF